MSNMAGYKVTGVGLVGSGNGGEIVHFELMGANGMKQPFLVPVRSMNTILLGLQAAMKLAMAECAKRPGFDPSHFGPWLALEHFEVGHAVAPGRLSAVALRLKTKTAVTMDLTLQPDQAEAVAQA